MKVKYCLWCFLVVVFATRCKSTNQPCYLAPLPGKLLSTLNSVHNVSLKINSNIEFGTMVQFVAEVFSQSQRNATENNCSVVLGVVGDIDAKTASIIFTLASRANLSITLVSAVAPSTFLPTTNLDLPNLLHMNPLTHYVEVLAAFLDHLNWTRIGVISGDTPYYEFAAELIQQKLLENPERRIIPFLRIREDDNKAKAVQAFDSYGTDVIVISTTNKVACSLVQEANRMGLVWPEYALILFDFGVYSLTETCQNKGVILLQELSRNAIDSNRFSAILAATISASDSNEEGQLEFSQGKRLFNVTISKQHNNSKSSEEIAFYNPETQQLTILFSAFLFADKPRGVILKKSFNRSALLHALIYIAFFLMFSFITIILILYIYFRNEPEIKAISVTVSLFMFLGCYVLIFYLPLLLIDPKVSIRCHLLIWFSLGGLPFPLIIATLLIKMLRVYFIFLKPHSYKKKFFHDSFLVLYIVLLMSPSLAVLALWTIFDPFFLSELISQHKGYIFVHSRCIGNHTIQWLGSLIVYSFSLSIALIFLALKSSAIRYKHFRDTKATNAFAYLTVFDITLTLIYWYFFRLQELKPATLHTTSSVLSIGQCVAAMLCQGLLFVPTIEKETY